MTSLLQTTVWADFKTRHGWQVIPVSDQFLLTRGLARGINMIYGPELSLPDTMAARREFLAKIRQITKDRHAFLARLDFLNLWNEELATELTSLGLKKSFEEIQPEWRRWLNLEPTSAAILAQMKPKGRYNIALARRHGVIVAPSQHDAIFTHLLAETASRDGFTTRQPAYYHDLIQTLTETGHGELLVATYHGQPLAAAIIGYSSPSFPPEEEKLTEGFLEPGISETYGGHGSGPRRSLASSSFASYLHGASSSTHRDVMAPFLLHWTAAHRAKARGCHIYDLLAVAPPKDGKLQQKYAGITRFKENFGGQTVHLLGAWDLVNQPFTYRLFSVLERLRR